MTEKINDLFGYDGLKVIQRTDMLNFSLDSVLLAHFATILSKTKNILDIGTGNGAIALMMTKRTTAHITGVELQKEVAEIAKRSVQLNDLEAQIKIVNANVVDFTTGAIPKYDLVVSNPPFFKYSEKSNVNVSDYKTIARHEQFLPLDVLLKSATKVLKVHGYFAMVHRAERIDEILLAMHAHKIVPKKIQFVHPKRYQDANAVLVEGIYMGNIGSVKILPPMIAHEDDGEYSREVKSLFLTK